MVNQSVGPVLLTSQKKLSPGWRKLPNSNNLPNSKDSGVCTEIHICWGVIGGQSGKSRAIYLYYIFGMLLIFVMLQHQFNCFFIFQLGKFANRLTKLLIKVLIFKASL